MVMRKAIKRTICLLLMTVSVFPIPVLATEKEQIPFDLQRFLYVVKRQENPYLGLEIFEYTMEWIEEDRKKMEESQPYQVSQMIFVGDSRVVGMSLTGQYCYVGKESIGYDWFVSEGIYQMLEQMYAWPEADVILCFGINDVANIGSYIAEYRYLKEAYPETRFWFMSVNPVDDALASSCGYYINSDMVRNFNDILWQAFPEEYLDCCSYLQENGFGTSDGVHYDMGTYVVIQEYAKYLIELKEN